MSTNQTPPRGAGIDPGVEAAVKEYSAFTDAMTLDRKMRKADQDLAAAHAARTRVQKAVATLNKSRRGFQDAVIRSLRTVGASDPYVAEITRTMTAQRRLSKNTRHYMALPGKFLSSRRRMRAAARREQAAKVMASLRPAERAFVRASNEMPTKAEVERINQAIEAAEGRFERMRELLDLRNHSGRESTKLMGEALRARMLSLSPEQVEAVSRALGRGGRGKSGTTRLVIAGKYISTMLPLTPVERDALSSSLKGSGTLNLITRAFIGAHDRDKEHDEWDRGERGP